MSASVVHETEVVDCFVEQRSIAQQHKWCSCVGACTGRARARACGARCSDLSTLRSLRRLELDLGNGQVARGTCATSAPRSPRALEQGARTDEDEALRGIDHEEWARPTGAKVFI